MIIYQNKSGVIEYDSITPCVTVRFEGFMNSEEFRDFLNKGLDFLVSEMGKRKREILWLADTRKHEVQPARDTQWVSDVWNPKAFKAGLRHVAFVLPEKVFGQLAVNNYAKENDQKDESKMAIKMFGDPEKAKNWYKESYAHTV